MNITAVAGLNEVERFDVEYKGTAFWFEAHKQSLTPQFLQRCYDSATQPVQAAKALQSVLTAWSVCSDEEGTLWPLTVDDMARLPIEFLNVIVDRIAESWHGEKKPQGTSQSTSAASA
jgi:hypothetical protein